MSHNVFLAQLSHWTVSLLAERSFFMKASFYVFDVPADIEIRYCDIKIYRICLRAKFSPKKRARKA